MFCPSGLTGRMDDGRATRDDVSFSCLLYTSTKYEHVIPQLVAIEESQEIEGLLILLNTVGGDIEAGLALAELIAGMKKPTVSLVLGGGHSIGVPLAVAAKKSFIAPSATMTIHPVRINGLVLGVPPVSYTHLLCFHHHYRAGGELQVRERRGDPHSGYRHP